jgi:lysophospholipase L1-like esterase
MRLPRALALVLAAAVAALAGTTAAPAASRSVLLYGDSLAVGTGIYLPGFLRGWSVSQSSDVSRHTSSVSDGLRAYGSTLPRVLVISLGANDDPGAVSWFARYVRDTVRVAGPTRCVIWANVLRPPYNGVSYDGYNRVLRAADARYRTLRVFDWVAMAHAHPSWFGGDGVHPTAIGYRARAQALARMVRAC